MPTTKTSKKPRVFIVVSNGACAAELITTSSKKADLYCKKQNKAWPSLKFRKVSVEEYGDFCYDAGYDSGFDEGSAGDDW